MKPPWIYWPIWLVFPSSQNNVSWCNITLSDGGHELIHFESSGWRVERPRSFFQQLGRLFPRVTFSWTQMSQHRKCSVFPKKCTWKWIDVWNGCQIIYLRSNNGATLIVPPPKRHSPTLLYWLLRFFSCRPAPCGCGVLSINWMAQGLHPRRFP